VFKWNPPLVCRATSPTSLPGRGLDVQRVLLFVPSLPFQLSHSPTLLSYRSLLQRWTNALDLIPLRRNSLPPPLSHLRPTPCPHVCPPPFNPDQVRTPPDSYQSLPLFLLFSCRQWKNPGLALCLFPSPPYLSAPFERETIPPSIKFRSAFSYCFLEAPFIIPDRSRITALLRHSLGMISEPQSC